MRLDYNKNELLGLMRDFYLLTGIRIVLFDSGYKELLSYPESHCRFCAYMKSKPATSSLCDESDRNSFSACKLKNEIIIYHCHAGLIEATAPLKDHNTVIGYLMFGQISDAENAQELEKILGRSLTDRKAAVSSSCDEDGHSCHNPASPAVSDFTDSGDDSLCSRSPEETAAAASADGAESILRPFTSDIPLRSAGQIRAAARIMEACTFYIILKNTVTVRRDNFVRNMDGYLTEHLADDLSINALSKAFGISKSKLYHHFSINYDTGIAEHIRYLRIEAAKKYLAETDLSVTDISERVGFTDYNYFCRIFKKEAGISAKKYRQSQRNLQ